MRLSLQVVLLAGLVLGPSLAWGCPFCEAPTLTLTEQITQADAAVLAKWTGGTPAGKDAAGKLTAGTTTYEVVEVVRDPLKTLKPGATLTLPRHRAGKPGDLTLMFGTKGVSLEWVPLPVTEARYKYIIQAPSPDLPTQERLKYFVKFLEDPDNDIAADAFGEFGNSKYEDIVAVVSVFPRDKLRKWVTGPQPVESMRRGLYGLMLGLCGTEEDAKAMEEKILAPTGGEFRLGIDGVMAGYLLIRKDAGLAVIEKAKFNNSKETFSETFYGITAVRFMWTYAKGVISPERLRASLRVLLDRPDIADLIISDLARWKDWSVMDRLMSLYGNGDYNLPGFKRSTVRYFMAAVKDRPKDAKAEVPQHVVAAEKHLAELRTRDPKLVADVEKYVNY